MLNAKPQTSIAILTFLAALIMRLVFAYQWHALPYGDAPLLDAKSYHLWAQEIANGQWTRGTAFYQSPLYPYVLAIIYKLFGHGMIVASVFNALLDAASCALLSRIAFRCFGPAAALATGLLAAIYRPLIFFTAPVMKETLGVFLLTVFLALALKALASGKIRDYVLSGLALGLAALTRSNFLVLAPAFIVLALIEQKKSALKKSALFLAALTFAILPATIHNAIASRDFVPITYNGGFNFYIGNSPFTEGATRYPPGISSDPLIGEEEDTRAVAEDALKRPLSPSEVSGFWFRLGEQALTENAKRTLILFTNKLWLFWDSNEHTDNYSMDFIARNFDTILAWPLIDFGIVAAAAAFAVVAQRRRKETLYLVTMALAYMLSVIVFYVTDRYRLPVVVFLLPLAGASVPAFARLMENNRMKRMAVAFAFTAFVVLASHRLVMGDPASEANGWGLLAHIESDAGKDKEALEMLEKGLAISPHALRREALNAGAVSAERLEKRGEAAALNERADKKRGLPPSRP